MSGRFRGAYNFRMPTDTHPAQSLPDPMREPLADQQLLMLLAPLADAGIALDDAERWFRS